MSSVEVRDVADGLWLWRQPHPAWEEGNDWVPEVASFAVRSGGVSLLLDPLAPHPRERAVWERRIESRPRGRDEARPRARRGPVRALVRRDRRTARCCSGPTTSRRRTLAPLRPGDVLPGGLVALDDGRNMLETPLYLPEQEALIFADGLTAPHGELLVWSTPYHETRVLPALRAMLGLPFEHVLVSHGEPVHTRADFEAALERKPWGEVEG